MEDRPDGLPHPTTVGELYLSAILDELRTLRSRSEGEGSVKPLTDPDTFHVKESVLNTPNKEG